MEKRPAHKVRLLELLSDHEPHHMSEMIRVGGYRYGARLYELRREGFRIVTVSVGDDEYAYRMLRKGEPFPGQTEVEQATLWGKA